MLISTKGRYAIRILTDIYQHQGDGCVTVHDIASREELSQKYSEALIKILVQHGFVSSFRGKNGGYRLSRPACEITVLDIVEVMEGKIETVPCLSASDGLICKKKASCKKIEMWNELAIRIRDFLSSYTISDMCEADDNDVWDYII